MDDKEQMIIIMLYSSITRAILAIFKAWLIPMNASITRTLSHGNQSQAVALVSSWHGEPSLRPCGDKAITLDTKELSVLKPKTVLL